MADIDNNLPTDADTGDRMTMDKLTPREREVANMAARGMTNVQIGKEIGISHRTVETYISNILHKLNISRRVELARFFST